MASGIRSVWLALCVSLGLFVLMYVCVCVFCNDTRALTVVAEAMETGAGATLVQVDLAARPGEAPLAQAAEA